MSELLTSHLEFGVKPLTSVYFRLLFVPHKYYIPQLFCAVYVILLLAIIVKESEGVQVS